MVNNNRLDTIWCLLARDTRHKQFVEERDIVTYLRRAHSEGIAFATQHLPRLRSATLAGLESGWLNTSSSDVRFGCKSGTSLPRFLFTAFHAVFTADGMLRNDYDVGAIDTLNTLLGLFGKIDGGHTPESEAAVVRNFIKTEDELHHFNMFVLPKLLSNGVLDCTAGSVRVRSVVDDAKYLVREVLSGLNPLDIHPKHGTGAAACGTPFHARFDTPILYRKIDRLWGYDSYWTLGASHLSDVDAPWRSVDRDPRAKVVLVPKDCRGPRLISCEPRETMWIQQGLMSLLTERLESHRLTRQQINFADQTMNRRLACIGSVTGSQWPSYYGSPIPSHSEKGDWCTLDLKDASDRVSADIAKELFPNLWAEALLACRSSTTELPDGRIVHMVKHAPMGAATCFPVMAMCIWAIAKSAIRRMHGNSPVYVYGDDIVVRCDHREIVEKALSAVGLLVNKAKSYSKGPFRESCGGEYVDAIDITPVRLRYEPTDDAHARLRTISFYNNCYLKYSGPETAALLGQLEKWYGPIATICGLGQTPSSNPAFISQSRTLTGVALVDAPNNARIPKRRNHRLNRTEYRVASVCPREITYHKDAWSHVLRALVQPRLQELGRDTLAKRNRIKYSWHWLGEGLNNPPQPI